MQSKKIIYALSSFYPDHRAGTETYVLNLSKEIIKFGYQVSIIIPAVGSASNKYNYEGIPVFAFSVPKKIGAKELNGLVEPPGMDEFKMLLKQINPQIFHLHTATRSLHAEHLKVAKLMGIKTVYTAHLGNNFCITGELLYKGRKLCNGFVSSKRCLPCFIKNNKSIPTPLNDIIGFLIEKLLKNRQFKRNYPALHVLNNKLNQLNLIRQFSDVNIAIAPWIENTLKLNNIGNIELVPQAISHEFISEKGRMLKKVECPIKLIYIGRINYGKGVHLLFEALTQFEYNDFDLTIVALKDEAEMEFYQRIKAKFYSLGYSKWFESINQSEVADMLEIADLLVLPSIRNEAAPLVILEAFAKKIPVLGSDYIAIQDMVKDNYNGILFRNNDLNSLITKLKFISSNPDFLIKLVNNITIPRTFGQVAIEMDNIYGNIT